MQPSGDTPARSAVNMPNLSSLGFPPLCWVLPHPAESAGMAENCWHRRHWATCTQRHRRRKGACAAMEGTMLYKSPKCATKQQGNNIYLQYWSSNANEIVRLSHSNCVRK